MTETNTVRAKNFYQSTLLTLITGWLFVSSCGSFVFANSGIGANIDRNCSVMGTGHAECHFTNTGWSPGSTCVRVGVRRNADGMVLGHVLACSGRLDINDSEAVNVSVLDGSVTPLEFCGGSLATPWTALCSVTIDPADS